MSANTKIVVLRRKELLYTGIFADAGSAVRHITVNVMLPGKAADTSGAPDPLTVLPRPLCRTMWRDLGRIPQSAQTEDVSTGAVADTDAVWIMLPGLSVLIIHISRGSTPQS